MHTNMKVPEKADRTIYLGFLWDNASCRSAKFKMCFCKVMLWIYAEDCGRSQHFRCPMDCSITTLECSKRAISPSCGRSWIQIWGYYARGRDVESLWGSSAVSLGKGNVNLAQPLLSSFLLREDSSALQMDKVLSSRSDPDNSLTGEYRISTFFCTVFPTDIIKESSLQHTGF